MKRLSLLAVSAVLLALSGTASAHPPDSIAVSVDSTHFLMVEVHHPVKTWPGEHYVAKVTVNLNGKPVVTQNFSSQSSQDWQYCYYLVNDAQPGDKVSVTAACSMFGKLTVDHVVPKLE